MGPRNGSTSACLRRRLFVPEAAGDEDPDGPRTLDWVLEPPPAPRRSWRPLGVAVALLGALLALSAGGAAVVGAGVAGGAVAWTLLSAPDDGASSAARP